MINIVGNLFGSLFRDIRVTVNVFAGGEWTPKQDVQIAQTALARGIAISFVIFVLGLIVVATTMIFDHPVVHKVHNFLLVLGALLCCAFLVAYGWVTKQTGCCQDDMEGNTPD